MSKANQPGSDTSLDPKAENPTYGVTGDSGSNTDESESPKWWKTRFSDETGETGTETDSDDWNRQQKRVFQRTNTLLRYWEARNYEVLWITLTSSPESRPASELAYDYQRLRQRIERAKRAVCDPDVCPHHNEATAHELGHVGALEHLTIRTCEGPQGVIHTFLAWDANRLRDGNHSKEFYIPQNWLSDQWADIHGTEVPLEPNELQLWPESQATRLEWLRREQSRAPFIVDVRRYGPDHTDGEHSPEAVAAYAASQYLGDHGEALEHMSWSHGRSIGGSLSESWEKLKGFCGPLDQAVEVWKRVISGERVTLNADSGNGINYEIVVEPPPNLSVTQSANVTPPEDYVPPGPRGETEVTSYSDGTGIESGTSMDWESDRDRFGQQSLSGTDVSLRVMNHRQRGLGYR